MKRASTWIRLALALAATAGLLLPTQATAQDESAATLGGFQGTAAASGLHAFYFPDGLLPTGPPVDLGAPDALATISSGPATFARASVLDPGDLLSNPDALLAQAGAGYEAGTLPPYPYRAVANSSSGEPEAESNPAPGLTAKAQAREDGSNARAAFPAINTPAIATVDTLVAEASTSTDGSTVSVRALSKAGGFDVLGLIKIDAITTEVTATSDGTETKLTGGTTVAGASILGIPVTIDATGVQLREAEGLLGGLNGVLSPLLPTVSKTLNDTLAAVGVRISVLGPVQLAGGAEGQIGSTGLRIDLELSQDTVPALIDLVNSLPTPELIPGAPGLADIVQVARTRNLVALEIGRAKVGLAARGFGESDSGTFDVVPDANVDLGGDFSTSDPGSFGSVNPGVNAPAESTPSAPAANRNNAPLGQGIGALVLLALVAQLLVGDRLAAFARSTLAPTQASACPREGR